MENADLTTLLERLAASGVEFILVGGLAAVAQGAPVTTFDVDIVHRRSEENVDRLIGFLAGIEAHHRRPAPPLPPDRSALLGPGHSLFTTQLGPLDVLGTIDLGLSYEALLADAIDVDLDGQVVKMLSLEAIVRGKRTSAHPKDRLVLPVLEAALQQRKQEE
jgi:predicted nucleotidyltransferase